jgi:hypothetical protein
MNQFLLPVVARAVPQLRVRGLEMPPTLVRAFAHANFFDATLLLGPVRMPTSWSATQIGDCRKALFASPRLAKTLGQQPVRPEALRDVPLISPVYSIDGHFIPVDDDCPLPASDRRAGHEVQTLGAALELAAHVDQLVFGPVFAAAHHVARGALVEVTVRGWRRRDPVYLACNVDRMLAPVQATLVSSLRTALSALAR